MWFPHNQERTGNSLNQDPYANDPMPGVCSHEAAYIVNSDPILKLKSSSPVSSQPPRITWLSISHNRNQLGIKVKWPAY